MISRIKAHMDSIPYKDSRGLVYKYGEFFPPEIAPFGYNETMAYDWLPLSRSKAMGMGLRWVEEPERHTSYDIRHQDLPDSVTDVLPDIVGKIISCAHAGECGQKCTLGFKIVPDEFNFLKAKNIALPRLCPNCRHYERVNKMQRYYLYMRRCMCKSGHRHGEGNCSNEFQTPYAPDRPEIIYCESCYNAEIA